MHITCVICSDLFTGCDDETVFATPCGHLFHHHCLIEWLERSKTCPQCRRKTSEKTIIRVYFSVNVAGGSEKDASFLKNKVDSLLFQMKLKDTEIKNVNIENNKLKKQNVLQRDEIKSLLQKTSVGESTILALQEKIRYLKIECKEASLAKCEAEELRKQLESYNSLEIILQGSLENTEEELERAELEPEHLRMCVSTFKKELAISKKELIEMNTLLNLSKKEANRWQNEVKKLQDEISILTRVNQKLKEDVAVSERDVSSLKEKIRDLENAVMSDDSDNKAIRRMLLENPAPESSVLNKTNLYEPSPTDRNIRSPSLAFKKKKNNDKIMSFKIPKIVTPETVSPKKELCSESLGSADSVLLCRNEDKKINLFKKPVRSLNVGMAIAGSSSSSSGSGFSAGVYNGFGGHSKEDDFSFRYRETIQTEKFRKLTKKKHLSASAVSFSKKMKPTTLRTLDSFMSPFNME